MKKNKFLLVASIVALASCSTNDELESLKNDNYVDVRVILGGEYISSMDSPLITRANDKKDTYYYINIYSDNGKVFAGGIFDNTDSICARLPFGTYSMQAMCLEESDIHFFEAQNKKPEVTNHFVEGKQVKTSAFSTYTSADTSWMEIYGCPLIQYYGENKSFSVNGYTSNVPVELLQYSYGITYNVTPPLSGELMVETIYSYVIVTHKGDQNEGPRYRTDKYQYSLNPVETTSMVISPLSYAEPNTFWTRISFVVNGQTIYNNSFEFTVERNTMKNINIDLNGLLTNSVSPIDISLEKTFLNNEDITIK